ncbi:unnamed protein product [Symbiodinium natans]|uniref:Uncharacterized protein n=1 Tax=Symbiodinium natans TaxID=878477 RepID=A0A812MXK9_9DINO|nr:unnamed protein product [Symbiodinium natans]
MRRLGRMAIGATAGKKAPWERAWEDFVRLDREAELHGSRRIGLGCADSDVDVVTSLPLESLVDLVRSPAPASPARTFELLEHVRWARVPRLILKHRPTEIEVDVINCQLDHQSHERDEVIHVFLDACPIARDFMVLIGEWVHQHSALMPPKQGFPNTYTFRMIGFHFLQTRKPGPLLPALADSGAALRDSHFLDTDEDASQLFTDWLRLLVRAGASHGRLWADLRNPWDTGPEEIKWGVIDPVSGRNITQFRGDQAKRIAALAAKELRLRRKPRSTLAELGKLQQFCGFLSSSYWTFLDRACKS